MRREWRATFFLLRSTPRELGDLILMIVVDGHWMIFFFYNPLKGAKSIAGKIMYLLLGSKSHWYTGHDSETFILGCAPNADEAEKLMDKAIGTATVLKRKSREATLHNGTVLWLFQVPEMKPETVLFTKAVRLR